MRRSRNPKTNVQLTSTQGTVLGAHGIAWIDTLGSMPKSGIRTGSFLIVKGPFMALR